MPKNPPSCRHRLTGIRVVGHKPPSAVPQALQGEVGHCVLMIVVNISLRAMEFLSAVLKTPWDGEPAPHHTPQDTSDEDWLQSILPWSARMCMGTAGLTSGPTDSNGVGLDRYETIGKTGERRGEESTPSAMLPQSRIFGSCRIAEQHPATRTTRRYQARCRRR